MLRRSAKVSSELRINYGPGYRVYFVQRGTRYMLLFAGGRRARRMATSPTPNGWLLNMRSERWREMSRHRSHSTPQNCLGSDEAIATTSPRRRDVDIDPITHAIGVAAKVCRGMSDIARQTGLSRESSLQGSERRGPSPIRDDHSRPPSAWPSASCRTGGRSPPTSAPRRSSHFRRGRATGYVPALACSRWDIPR